MKDNKSGWQFPKALEIIKCKEGNKEFMKERPARRPFGNTVLICEYPIDDTAAEEPNAKFSYIIAYYKYDVKVTYALILSKN